MTREEAKQLLPVVQAWAEGRAIEARSVVDDRWVEVNYSVDFSRGARNYRVKPQPKYRPFKDADECWQEMQKHQPFGWLKDKLSGTYVNVGYVPIDNEVSGFNSLTFADGQPFGILEELTLDDLYKEIMEP